MSGIAADPMSVFSAKLNELIRTVELAVAANVIDLARVLCAGRTRRALAVGSGGSTVAAEYLATCRGTLQAASTKVCTPLELVLSSEDLTQAEVWLFSARGDNPDILAAFRAAVTRQALAIHVLTANEYGTLPTRALAHDNARLHIVPVADPKDGFLATHSLVSTLITLLRAANRCAITETDEAYDASIVDAARKRFAIEYRANLESKFASLKATDTLMLLFDPRVSPASVLVESSTWEAAICPVQRTDFRNFAHGRHVWLSSSRGKDTVILSLTGTDTRDAWHDIEALIPTDIRKVHLDYGNCGRFQNLLGVFDALAVIEAMARAQQIDPGRPIVGQFATGIYGAPSLDHLTSRLTPAVRQKQAAALLKDDPRCSTVDMVAEETAVRQRLRAATFRGVVLDYDGTVVTTEGRYDPPRPEIVAELERLLNQGLIIGFATGRGGSAGEQLRTHLSERHHPKVLMGYYNGAHMRPLNVDIRQDPPQRHPSIVAALDWLHSRPELFVDGNVAGVKDSGVQATVEMGKLRDPEGFSAIFDSLFASEGRLRLSRSQHTFDICMIDACKTSVVRALTGMLSDASASILCVGDSGEILGNDHALLGLPYGISVRRVSDRADTCWSFFGLALTGPDALLRILRALRSERGDGFRLVVDELALDLQPRSMVRKKNIESGGP